ncbi:transcriptional regulator [Mycoplasmatota bacterium]|nr:transcriptional regulator [Mycoplasmatota bacterium]
MTKDDLISIVSKKIRLLRSEYNFSQAKMSEILGISKKTLVQIEKERIISSWTMVVAICGIFRESEILKMTLGGDPIELVEAIVFESVSVPRNITGGGRMFWRTVDSRGKFKVQKNIISSHYRIIDGNEKRWYSSFNKEFIMEEFQMLIKRSEDHEEEIE